MGVGLVLFWPSLFFLEGGDGPEAAEFSQLKGEFEALRQNSVQKECGIAKLSPEDIIKTAEAPAKQEAISVVEDSSAQYTGKVKELAEAKNCREAVSLEKVTETTESWVLSCGEGKKLIIKFFDGDCYIKS